MATRSDTAPPKAETVIPYGRQWIDDDDVAAVDAVLRSDWLTTGPHIESFERAFAAAVGAREAVAVSNGTAALHTAMHALAIGPGDEVVVPPMTFAATANAVVYQGGTPVFADVDPETLLLDPEAASARVTERTKAIAAVDYAGQPCDYRPLRTLAERHGLRLVDDACHALGGRDGDRTVGTLADLNTFSLHPVKPITSGEGGVITTEDPELARRMRVFRNHGITTDHRQREAEGSWFYEMADLGFNYRLTDFQCALGESQLRKLPAWVARRRAIANRYDQAFAGNDLFTPLAVRPGVTHAYHLYVVQLRLERLRVGAGRREVFAALRAAGIGVNVHYVPVHLHPYYRERFGTGPGLCPRAEAAYERILTLPLFARMTDEQAGTVIETTLEVIASFAAEDTPMKKFKDVEKTRIQAHKDPARDSVHRASLLVPELPGAVAEISFVNHFLLKRGYPHVACRVTAIDAEGQRIEARLHPIDEPRVYRFRLTGSVDAPVETYMVEFFAADNLFIPFPAVMVNHHGPGFYNTVHAFNRVLNDVFENDAINAQQGAEASIDVDLSGGRDTFAVFTSGPTACRGELALDLATPGRAYHAAVAVDRPRLTQQLVSVRETFPDVDGTTSGVLKIRQPDQFLFYGRMLAGIRSPDGAFSANHSYYDCSGLPEYWEDGRGSYRSYPHFPSFQSAIRMYPVQSPGGLQLTVGLHGADGKELARAQAGCVDSPGPRVLEADVATLARGVGIAPEDVRTFVVYADAPDGAAVPCRANHQLAYSSGGLSSSINVSLFNPNVYTPQRPGLTWAQSIVGDGVDSRFAIVGNSPAADGCDVEMAFYDESGHVADRTRRLVAGGSVEIDPARDLGLAGGAPRPVWVIARCARPDVSLFGVTRDRSTGNCSGEHGF